MQSLDPRYITLVFWRLSLGLIFVLFLFALVFVLLPFLENKLVSQAYWLTLVLVCFGLCVVLMPLFWLFAKWSWCFFKYELREDGFWRESGIIWKSYCTIPYSRIQNIDIYRHPLERLLGLSRLHIHTAGNSVPYYFAEGKVPGLSMEAAEKIRKELVRRSNEFKPPKDI